MGVDGCGPEFDNNVAGEICPQTECFKIKASRGGGVSGHCRMRYAYLHTYHTVDCDMLFQWL